MAVDGKDTQLKALVVLTGLFHDAAQEPPPWPALHRTPQTWLWNKRVIKILLDVVFNR